MILVESRLHMPPMSGVYKLTNKVNGKTYIGKSVNLKKRFADYRGDIKKGKKRFILDAIRKYGWEGFKLEIIELYPGKISNDFLLERERFWIRIYGSLKRGVGYNLCEYSRDRTGIPLSEEHKRKIGESNKKVLRVPTQEQIDRIRAYGLSMKGKKFSQEHRRKISLGRKDRLIANKIDPTSGEIVETYHSISHAEKTIGAKPGSIYYAVKTNKLLKNFYWSCEKP